MVEIKTVECKHCGVKYVDGIVNHKCDRIPRNIPIVKDRIKWW